MEDERRRRKELEEALVARLEQSHGFWRAVQINTLRLGYAILVGLWLYRQRLGISETPRILSAVAVGMQLCTKVSARMLAVCCVPTLLVDAWRVMGQHALSSWLGLAFSAAFVLVGWAAHDTLQFFDRDARTRLEQLKTK